MSEKNIKTVEGMKVESKFPLNKDTIDFIKKREGIITENTEFVRVENPIINPDLLNKVSKELNDAKTVGELREAISKLPDDMPFERGYAGIWVEEDVQPIFDENGVIIPNHVRVHGTVLNIDETC